MVIRGGFVVDGTRSVGRTADVAIDDGIVTAVGQIGGRGIRELDADGLLVTPGFVDVHSHYDGQATWDPVLAPSAWHGVTTTVMGNCGVGFAPVAPDRHEWLIGLMEGVEDIPGAALSVGIDWQWETFPDFLDHLATKQWTMDVGTQVPHGAVRAYVMGERGARNQPATPADIEAMAAIVAEGLDAGALGFSTSRTLAHRAVDGEPVPGTFAANDELFGIGLALAEAGFGVFELAAAGALGEDVAAPPKEMEWMRRLAAEIGRPVLFGLTQNNSAPDQWAEMLELLAEARAGGSNVIGQVHPRTVSILQGLQTFHPFMFTPAWGELGMGFRSLPEQVAAMGTPEVRARMLVEIEQSDDPVVRGLLTPDLTFVLGDPPNYTPGYEDSIAGIAELEGRTAWEVLYDRLIEGDGGELLNTPVLNYSQKSLEPAREMLESPYTAFGLGDGGAHASQTCDASVTTWMLSYWARDRGEDRFPVEHSVAMMTSETADLYGLRDRGRLIPGMAGDVNLIDLESLALTRPHLEWDLPGGAKRLIQEADGYVATVKRGTVTFENGEWTGETPGSLLKGPQAASAAA